MYFFLKTWIKIRCMSIQWSSLNVIYLFGQSINNCVKERIVNYQQLLDDSKLASTFMSHHLLSRRVQFLYKSIFGGIDIWTLMIISRHDGIYINLSYFICTQLILNLWLGTLNSYSNVLKLGRSVTPPCKLTSQAFPHDKHG